MVLKTTDFYPRNPEAETNQSFVLLHLLLFNVVFLSGFKIINYEFLLVIIVILTGF